MRKGKILVVDDEASIRQIVEARLTMSGFIVETAEDGEDALKVFSQSTFDLVVLDVMMPKLDGLQLCKMLRHKYDTPIIMLTAKGEIPDRINALEMGADDYLTKPFSPRELEARIKAVLRRTMGGSEKPATIDVENISVDLIKRQVYRQGEKVKLTEMEFSLLELLVLNPGNPFTRNEILQQVWGYRSNQYSDTRVVDVHVSRLRSKLEEDVSEPELILTARGTGYMFQNYQLNTSISQD